MKCFVHLFWFLLLFLGLFNVSRGTLQHMGCFDLDYSLSMSYHRHIVDVNLNKCVTLCGFRNTKYAGIEKSDNFCYCGGDIAEASGRRNDTLCDVSCPDDITAVCGGDWLMSVYMISDFNASAIEVSRYPSAITPAPTGVVHDVGFLVGLSVGITMYNSSNMNNFNLIMSTTDWVYSVDYHYSKKLAFAFLQRRIYKTTLGHKATIFNPLTSVVRSVGRCDGFAVDWENDRIYWASCEPSGVAILSSDLSGANVTTVLRRPGDPVTVKNMILDPYEKMVFWTGDGVVESCTFSGIFQTNLTNPETPVRSLCLDLKTRRLFYTSVDSQSSGLHSIDYEGSGRQEHFRLLQLKGVYGLGVFRDYVYWVNFAGSRDIIYQAPLNLTSLEQVELLKTTEKTVWHMRLVHPELQTNPGPNPCDNKRCSHRCAVVSQTAQCVCPLGLQLDNRGSTCINFTELVQVTIKPSWREPSAIGRSAASQGSTRSRPDPTTALLVVILAGAALTVVLGLLYFGNQHWSSIQAKLSRVPYMRQEQQAQNRANNPQYDITEDTVNLI